MAYSTPQKQSEYMRGYYAANRGKMLEGMRVWRSKNSERYLAQHRAYHHKHRETILPQKRAKWKANSTALNARRREKKFGMSVEAYAMMAAAQDGKCAICRDQRKLVVDHCHKTGRVRALLCSPCNTALGLFKEEAKRMRAAIRYLTQEWR